jgi:hypothetical protein
MGGFLDKLWNDTKQGVRDLGNDIAPGSGNDLVTIGELAALYFVPSMVGEAVQWQLGSTAFGTLSASTIYTAGAVAKGLTTLYILDQMGSDMAQAPTPVTSAMAQGVLINTASNVAALPVIYGTRKVGGTRVFVNVSGATNEYLHLVVALSEGEIDSFNSVYIDDVLVTDTKFTGLVSWAFFAGVNTQASNAALMADLPSFWTANHNGHGVGYIYLKLKYSTTAFSGLPTITADVKGVKVYDPRTSTTAWSDNPALCVRDYLTSTRYGKGIPASLIDDASIIAAANYCDELVTIPTGTQKRYTCNGVVNVDNTAYNNVKSLLTSCRGMLVFSAGKYKLIPDRATTAAFTFDEDNITGNWTIATAGRKDRVNRVTATFYDPNNSWQPNYGISDSTAYRAVDNGLMLEATLDLPFTTNLYTAQQLAGLQLKQSRFGLTVSFSAFQSALRCEVGDVVNITHTTTGWVNKTFRVFSMVLRDDDDVEVVLHEYDATVYNLDTLTAITSTPTLSLPNPFAITTPSALTLSSGTSDLLIGGDGSIISRIKCVWTPPGDVFTTIAEIEYKLSTDTAWQSIADAEAAQGVAYISPVKDTLIYNVRIRFVNSMGTQSAWYTASPHTVAGKSAPPADVTSLAYVTNEAGIQLSWDMCADKDYQDTTIKVGASWAAGTIIYQGTANTFLWTRPTGTAFNIWAKHRDTSGNYSAGTGALSVTYAAVALDNSTITLSSSGTLSGAGGGSISLGSIPGSLTSGQVAAGIISANAFAAGIEPVSVVSSVPGTLTTRAIVNTTDGKLYRWNGSAYVATVPTTDLSGTVADAQIAGMAASKVTGTLSDSQLAAIAAAKITGQIVSTQITDNSITTAKINAGAVTASQIAADTITASQIAAGAITSSELAAGAVVAGKIAAGTIQAADIAAGAITTGKLVVAPSAGQNIWLDAGFADTAAWTICNWGAFPTQGSVTDGVSGTTTLRGGVGGASAYGTNRVPVAIGKQYKVSCKARNVGGNGTMYLRIDAYTTKNTGGYTQIAGSVEGVVPSGTWSEFSWIWTATTPWASPMVLVNYSSTAGYMEAQDIRIEELVTGELIVDGAITAAKIAANTITAGQIAAGAITATQLAANTITAGQIAANTITAGQIAANTITASQIAAGAITANEIATGTITAAKISAGTITTDRLVANAATVAASSGRAYFSTVSSVAATSVTVLSGSSLLTCTGAPVTLNALLDIGVICNLSTLYWFQVNVYLKDETGNFGLGWSVPPALGGGTTPVAFASEIYAYPTNSTFRNTRFQIPVICRFTDWIAGSHGVRFYLDVRGFTSLGAALTLPVGTTINAYADVILTENKV